eukprot:Rhum_TRINITY_DN22950_c0_g1::Rhum_TRINITY_DN22950_c0_g1_i1::g.176613::m.176613
MDNPLWERDASFELSETPRDAYCHGGSRLRMVAQRAEGRRAHGIVFRDKTFATKPGVEALVGGDSNFFRPPPPPGAAAAVRPPPASSRAALPEVTPKLPVRDGGSEAAALVGACRKRGDDGLVHLKFPHPGREAQFLKYAAQSISAGQCRSLLEERYDTMPMYSSFSKDETFRLPALPSLEQTQLIVVQRAAAKSRTKAKPLFKV